MDSMHEREIEIKWSLDETAHETLHRHLETAFGHSAVVQQTNRFFDTADFVLRRSGRSIRLRREDERLVLTCKQRAQPVGDWHDHREIEYRLNGCCWPAPAASYPDLVRQLPLPLDFIQLIGSAALISLGGFSNQRRIYVTDHGEVALDRTCFGSVHDHELEVETMRPAEDLRYWRQRLEDWQVPWQAQQRSKLERFLERQPGLTSAAIDAPCLT